MAEKRFSMGNHAMVEGAIAAGAKFYAGYPITPSSEVAELSSIRLPQVGGMFIQMEDEIGSMAAIIGASCSGAKAYTATSGPGFSLMQENLGVGIMGEIPCVIINVQRSGPSTGLATKPAQGDFMQVRYGTHGDHGIIALSPSSVQECYDCTIHAFNMAEKYRTPVILLADEIVGHMRESYELHTNIPIADRKKPEKGSDPKKYLPYDFENYEDQIAPLASYGGERIFRVNGSTHNAAGDASANPGNADKFIRHLTDKFEINRQDIIMTKSYQMEDAEYVIIAFGCSVRGALAAMRKARQEGIKVGVFQLITVWPFPSKEVSEILQKAKGIVVPELNLGQMIIEVQRLNSRNIPIAGVNRVDSQNITPSQIIEKIKEVIR